MVGVEKFAQDEDEIKNILEELMPSMADIIDRLLRTLHAARLKIAMTREEISLTEISGIMHILVVWFMRALLAALFRAEERLVNELRESAEKMMHKQ